METTRRILLTFPLLLAACPPTQYVRTGDERKLAARPPNCAFSLYTVAPPAGSIELGVVSYALDVDDFATARELAAPDVCAAGGDGLVIWTSNKDRLISRATIIKKPPPESAR